MATAKCVVAGSFSPLGVGASGTHQWEVVVDRSLDSLDKALQAVPVCQTRWHTLPLLQ